MSYRMLLRGSNGDGPTHLCSSRVLLNIDVNAQLGALVHNRGDPGACPVMNEQGRRSPFMHVLELELELLSAVCLPVYAE